MKKIFLSGSIIVSTIIFNPAFATPQNSSVTKLDRIIAIVNNDVITQSELNQEILQAKKQAQHTNSPLPPEGEIRKQVLNHLIDKNLQMQLARSKNIQATDQDIDTALNNIAKQNNMSLAQLKQALANSGTDYTEFRNRIHEQLLLQRLQQQEVVSKNLGITDQEVTEYMRKNQGKHQYSAFHVIDILIPVAEVSSQDQMKSAQQRADTIAKNLRHGNSMDTSKEPGIESNDLGWRTGPELPALFVTQIEALNKGGVTAPVKAPNGYHVLQLIDAKGEEIKLTKKDAQNLAFQKKAADAVQKWLQELRGSAYIKVMN